MSIRRPNGKVEFAEGINQVFGVRYIHIWRFPVSKASKAELVHPLSI